MNIQSENQCLDLIAERILSNNYWVFLTDSPDLLVEIQEQHYKPKTEAYEDFELIVTPFPIVIVFAICHKRRMSFDQIRKILSPHMSQRATRDFDSRHAKGCTDVFMIPSKDESMRYVTDFMFKLNGYLLRKEIQNHGWDKVMGTKCEYSSTMLAEQEGELSYVCPEKPSKAIGAFKKDGRPGTLALCSAHFYAVTNWMKKQPDLF